MIVLQENNRGSTVDTFREMIDAAGLEIVFTQGDHKELTRDCVFYFTGIVKKADASRLGGLGNPSRIKTNARPSG
ncbi:hypothetical protein QRQ56_30980 [Bradyrhizobium sp. U531]|uniref:hypothetical protein n=1 Tax=Bradyrhizobium sp. U531 TaxID=3053458 RepID=UPI003F444CBB